MYHQIAHNKRNSIILVALFLVVWLLAGFVIGEFGGGTSTAIAGAIILGLLGLGAAAFSYYFGAATVLAAAGAHDADRVNTSSSTTSSRRSPSAMACRSPRSTSSTT